MTARNESERFHATLNKALRFTSSVLGVVLTMAVSQTAMGQFEGKARYISDLIADGNSNAFDRLLESGYDINAPVTDKYFDAEDGRSAIFFAPGPGMLTYLISRGADPHHMDASGRLPIDVAYEGGNYDIVRYFAEKHPFSNTNTVCGYPERLLLYLVAMRTIPDGSPVYVQVNWQDPQPELMDWIRKRLPNALPNAYDVRTGTIKEAGVTYTADEWHALMLRRHGEKEVFRLSIQVKRRMGKNWNYAKSVNSGPLSGFFCNGVYKYVRKYKHWIIIHKGGGVS